MDIELLREFIVFARVMNVTKAARELNVSASTLSRHISSMECELGQPLFTRGTHGLALTSAGKMLLDSSSVIVPEYDRLSARVRGLRSANFGNVRVSYAMDDRTSVDAISRAFAELRDELGGAIVEYVPIRSRPIAESLAEGDIDLAVLFDPYATLEESVFEAVPFSKDRILAALPVSRELAPESPVRLADLQDCTLPWPTAARDDYLDRVLKMFNGCGRAPTTRWVDADNMDAFFMRDLEPGDAWFFSERQYRNYEGTTPASFRESVTVHPIVDADAELTRYAVFRRDNANAAVAMLARRMGQDGGLCTDRER
jgi:DNA-binding transcriptional LysR family regulator